MFSRTLSRYKSGNFAFWSTLIYNLGCMIDMSDTWLNKVLLLLLLLLLMILFFGYICNVCLYKDISFEISCLYSLNVLIFSLASTWYWS